MKKLNIILTLILTGSILINAQDIPEPMSPPRLVNDFAGFLNFNEQSSLEQNVRAFNNETSTQIYIVIVKSLNGYDKAQYAAELGEKWGIGQKGKDNGVLILIKPKYANEGGEVFIATGYGLEGLIPDAIAKRIIEFEIIPEFKRGNYYGGINAAVETIKSLALKEFTANDYKKKTSRRSSGSGIPAFIIMLLLFFVFFGGRNRGRRHHSMGGSLPFWVAMSMMGSGGRSSSGSFGGFSSGSGGFGGFSGGGGGSFGGGGAGGSW